MCANPTTIPFGDLISEVGDPSLHIKCSYMAQIALPTTAGWTILNLISKWDNGILEIVKKEKNRRLVMI